MSLQKEKNVESAFGLDKKLSFPLVLLLLMPFVMVVRGFLLFGMHDRNFYSLVLLLLVVVMFLPLLTRKTVISSRGITSRSMFSRKSISWGKVDKVAGYNFHGRAIIMIEGEGRRLSVTNITGNFSKLVGHVIDHAPGDSVEKDVAPLLLIKGCSGRDAFVLWAAVAGMAVLVLLNFL